ncbi:ethanolamine utilization protein EutQ [Paenibacillus dendritiformis]|uniref:cupin domain-containing protein n=1 Tax=Paenibacillus dendritiformis TaxID=130049 RepID=UPI001B1BDD69|nr:cupin domain-containing protein [Paenibacillus dendritiformis]GIO72903.1 ethanolamine utilization protein EutQ [Paenibacillus dendritiformis]
MKKLICAADVEEWAASGQKRCCIDSNTIVTPAARDKARELGVEFTHEPCGTLSSGAAGCQTQDDLDMNAIFTFFKMLSEKGLVEKLLGTALEPPYQAETDPAGLKLVRGRTVKMEACETGTSGAKVYRQEVIGKPDCSMSAGFLTVDHDSFSQVTAREETYIVLEGTLDVTLNERTFTAREGDVIFIPKGVQATKGSPDCARMFYMTYPAGEPDRKLQ